MKNLYVITILALWLFVSAKTADALQNPVPVKKKVYTTAHVQGKSPVIDGLFDDQAWSQVEWAGDFIQRQPNEGVAPSQFTKFKVLYDNNYLYVAIKSLDESPEKIIRRMSRRDGFEGDFVEVNIDSYFDKKTAFSFTATAAGVKGDQAITENGDSWDSSWDPIWYLSTQIVEDGWNAEMKIPLNQLRFNDNEEQVWGIQVTRRLFRKEERSNWQYIPLEAGGWVHNFGELRGIEGIKPKRQVDIAPYVVASTERYDADAENPFSTGVNNNLTVGVDGKVGLTNDLTLDFTINPDFGQVEADPSQVNLTAFESYFSEKRPFFIEGRNITNFQITGGDGGFSRDNLFYSRRIGRSPQYYPDGDYVDRPDNSKILGAIKVTGKTKNGWSVGVLESITDKEIAKINIGDDFNSQTVEPMTNYALARLSKDFNSGNSILGGIMTHTYRFIDDEHLEFMPTQAFTGGVDYKQYWNDKKYYLTSNLVFSDVQGSTGAILDKQQAPQRYFQRPDAEHVSVDTSLTSLKGHGGNLQVGKNSSTGLRYAMFFTWRSPGLELNDMGFLGESDYMLNIFWAGYRFTEPFAIFRTANINLNQWTVYDFGGNRNALGGNVNLWAQFTNQWSLGGGINRDAESRSNSMLRGGRAFLNPGYWNFWYNMSTDNRKKLRLSMGGSTVRGDFNYRDYQNAWFSLTYRPSNNLTVSLYPSYTLSKRDLQYVDQFDFNGKTEYLFAAIDQKTLSLTLRIDVNITPELTIQYYGAPFASMGSYSDFKLIENSLADEYTDRFAALDQNVITYNSTDATYAIDKDGDNNADYETGNPDFNFRQFRSNLVARWEYTPGSTLFLVWSQGLTSSELTSQFKIQDELDYMTREKADNVFLVKFSYRFQL